MKHDNPAFPLFIPSSIMAGTSNRGISILAYFAVHAPPAPEWFEPKMPHPIPPILSLPAHWTQEQRNDFRDIDLTDVSDPAVLAHWEEHQQREDERNKWKHMKRMFKAAQWPWAWALAMVEARP